MYWESLGELIKVIEVSMVSMGIEKEVRGFWGSVVELVGGI